MSHHYKQAIDQSSDKKRPNSSRIKVVFGYLFPSSTIHLVLYIISAAQGSEITFPNKMLLILWHDLPQLLPFSLARDECYSTESRCVTLTTPCSKNQTRHTAFPQSYTSEKYTSTSSRGYPLYRYISPHSTADFNVSRSCRVPSAVQTRRVVI